ncbi:hypothetical protein G3T36_17270 [Diaminobutyricibacter tongyongensis]|uniref:Uncharacterized protein n=1 Tax=Leifsonia tongyongensis TaxID=1268043 RepID=A0A6L9Y1R9_9MICO|nr:hypothetical protein [Diaminobutyricibacter tongyongensis]NEN07610.1 hypothetical protein [Diaminobutyricibacter tongyongensis]
MPIEDSESFLAPEGYLVHVGVGWFLTPAKVERVKNVQVGRSTVPGIFYVFVRRDDESQDASPIAIALNFIVHEGEPFLMNVVSVGLEVDEALKLVKSLRPLSWWKSKAILQLVFQRTDDDDDLDEQEKMRRHYEALLAVKDLPATRRRDRVTDALLKEVAEVYRQAWADGENPTQEVAKHFFKSHSTAARWVGMSRKKGYLGPADGPKGGELET